MFGILQRVLLGVDVCSKRARLKISDLLHEVGIKRSKLVWGFELNTEIKSRITGGVTKKLFVATVLGKYPVAYYECQDTVLYRQKILTG